MKNCKIESATILCRNCEMIYGFDVQTTQEGFRVTKCPLCRHEQMVWIEFRCIVVPVSIGYAKRCSY